MGEFCKNIKFCLKKSIYKIMFIQYNVNTSAKKNKNFTKGIAKIKKIL